MSSVRLILAVSVLAAPATVSRPTQAQQVRSSSPSGEHDFDFLVGEWRVHHRRQTPDGNRWMEFEGTASNRPLMSGMANVEEHALEASNGAYRAVALRAYDPKSTQWAIWWLDGRYPSGPLDPPAKGRFENGVGRFFGDYVQNGKPMRGRILWSNITATSARWEQASSSDGGRTWVTNWIMLFERDTRKPTSAADDRAAAGEFGFLLGDWRVHHRYLRVKDGTREWVDVEGSASNRSLMRGRGNIEEHTIQAPSGTYGGLALRSYDPKAMRWSIWWLDGRTPHGDLDPAMQGRFESGLGTFSGDTIVNGKTIRARMVWSQIAGASARWEQAYSPDAGKTWEPNWVMEFRRPS